MKKSTYNVAYDFRKRLFILTIALMLFLSYLLFNLFKLQVSSHEYYKNKVYDQITTTTRKRFSSRFMRKPPTGSIKMS